MSEIFLKQWVLGSKRTNVRKQWSIIFYGDEKWTVHVSPEEARAEEGKTVENADCIIKADPQLFVIWSQKERCQSLGTWVQIKPTHLPY